MCGPISGNKALVSSNPEMGAYDHHMTVLASICYRGWGTPTLQEGTLEMTVALRSLQFSASFGMLHPK